MGLLQTITSALGLQKPLVVREIAGLSLSRSARKALDALNEPIVLSTEPHGGIRRIVVRPGLIEGIRSGLHPNLYITDSDLKRLRGMELDMHQGHWRVVIPMRLFGADTPNPESRLYSTDRWLHRGPPAYFTQSQGAPPLAQALLQSPHVESILFRDHTFTVERVKETPWYQIDQDIDARLRRALLGCVPTIEQVGEPEFSNELEQRVWDVLKSDVLPAMHKDGGDLQILQIEEGIVKVALNGACASCPASTLTLKAMVEKTLIEAFPTEIFGVEAI